MSQGKESPVWEAKSWLDPASMKALETAAVISDAIHIHHLDRAAIFLGLYANGHVPNIFRYPDSMIKFTSTHYLVNQDYAYPYNSLVPFSKGGKDTLSVAAERAFAYHAGIVKPQDLLYGTLIPGGFTAAVLQSLGVEAAKIRPDDEYYPDPTWLINTGLLLVNQFCGMPERYISTDRVADSGVVLPANPTDILAKLPSDFDFLK